MSIQPDGNKNGKKERRLQLSVSEKRPGWVGGSAKPHTPMISIDVAQGGEAVLTRCSPRQGLERLPLIETPRVVFGSLDMFSGSNVEDDIYEIVENGGRATDVFPSRMELCMPLQARKQPLGFAEAVVGVLNVPSGSLRVLVSGHPLDPARDGRPTGYGNLRTGQTEFDPAVRKAKKLSAMRGEDVVVTLGDRHEEVVAALEQEASKVLFPTQCKNGRTIVMECNKVNIYGPGDHFVRHVDTPHHDVVGTCVITCPRTMFACGSDGGLVVHGDGCRLQEPTDTVRPAYSMFYSDVVHQVTPISVGFRVSITYNLCLRNKDSDSDPDPDPDSDPDSDLDPGEGKSADVEVDDVDFVPPPELKRVKTGGPGENLACETCIRLGVLARPLSKEWLQAILDIVDRAEYKEQVAVLCSNKYSYDEVEAGLLKGFDAELVEQVGLNRPSWQQPTLVPVALHVDIDDLRNEDTKEPTVIDVRMYRMTRDDIMRVFTDKTGLFDGSVSLRLNKAYTLVVPCRSFLQRVYFSQDEGAMYTGNESRAMHMDARYMAACLLFHDQHDLTQSKTSAECVFGGECGDCACEV
jgi:hypothetical protein